MTTNLITEGKFSYIEQGEGDAYYRITRAYGRFEQFRRRNFLFFERKL